MNKKMNRSAGKEKLDDVFVQTRDVAAMMLCQKMFPETLWVDAFSSENYKSADMSVVRAIVNGGAPYEDIPDQVVSDILALTHVARYEIVPWREAVLSVLIKDFLSNLRTSSSILCEDAIARVVGLLGESNSETGESYRGTTKNATQIITGQRTRMRKTMRAFTLALMYEMRYRQTRTLDAMVADMDSLVRVVRDDDFFLDTFPIDVFGDDKGILNARGRFVLNEARKFVLVLMNHLKEIDEMIQKSSKNWRLERMSVNDLNIIRIATYELLFCKVSQTSVYMNEAVELSKTFGSDKSRNFVNGMLQQIWDDNKKAKA
ncbi:MAG: transcription antitermination factor NusB [Proteobacteria bacterium]|nr:transcription antitermination factor NusB [Pseudomonadota bacterium]